MITGIYNPSSSTLLLVASSGDATATAQVALAGTTVPVAMANGQGTLALSVHEVAAACSCRGTVTGGQGATDFNVGTPSGSVVPLQLVAPTVAGNPYHLYPTRKIDVIRHYLTDADMLDLLYKIVAIHAIPGMQQAAYAPISLDAPEQNAMTALQGALKAIPNLT